MIGRIGMGLIGKLFGLHFPPSMPKIKSVFPQIAAQRLDNGQLTKIDVPFVMLQPGEICHFVDDSAIAVEQRYYRSHRNGTGFQIIKGVNWFFGDSTNIPETEVTYTNGKLVITNMRVLFIASKNGIDKKLSTLSAVTPYTNGIEMQFGSQSFTFLLADGKWAYKALKLII